MSFHEVISERDLNIDDLSRLCSGDKRFISSVITVEIIIAIANTESMVLLNKSKLNHYRL